ncbi:MAG: DODA-type extradiol aromatic ring-opening family dioxygenase [Leptospirillia bacterium]
MRLRSLFVSHGAPLSLDDEDWMSALKNFREKLKDFRGIIILSAHWVERGLFAGPLLPSPLIYDFWGFPERLYRIRYPAPPGKDLLPILQKLPGIGQVTPAPSRGLDHGMWVPLIGLLPQADIPVLGLSLPETDPAHLYALGQTLAPLMDEGILVVGSGGLTHNLGALRSEENHAVSTWAQEFDQWVVQKLEAANISSLLNFTKDAPNASLAHPTIEHFAPLFVAMGAAGERFQVSFPVDMFRYGSLSLRSVAFWN